MTSLFQKRSTWNPSRCKNASRVRSRAASKCWPPSTSTTSALSIHAKSAMYGPMGCWRRKRKPSNWRSLRTFQSLRSASVMSRRNSRARSRFCPCRMGTSCAVATAAFCPHPRLPPQAGEGGDRAGIGIGIGIGTGSGIWDLGSGEPAGLPDNAPPPLAGEGWGGGDGADSPDDAGAHPTPTHKATHPRIQKAARRRLSA